MITDVLEIGIMMMLLGGVLGLCGLIFEQLFAGFNVGAVICFLGLIVIFGAVFADLLMPAA